MVQWEDQYKDEYIDGMNDGEHSTEETSLGKYIREDQEFLATLKGRKPGFCGHCNIRMMGLTATIYKKRQKVGAICPLCYDMESWVGGLIDGQCKRD